MRREENQNQPRARPQIPVCSSHPPPGFSNELGTRWTQEGWDKGQGQGPKSRGAESTYTKALRAFHSPLTLMKESEMLRLRPWPGRGLRAEPRSSQLWMLRLRRETQGAQCQPRLGSSRSGALAPAPAPAPTLTPWGLGWESRLQAAVGLPQLPEHLLCVLC